MAKNYAAAMDPVTGEVMNVIVVPDSYLGDLQRSCAKHGRSGLVWLRDRDGTRVHPASPGGRYDAGRDEFIPRRPTDHEGRRMDSFQLDEITLQWTPPYPRPDDDKEYRWIERLGQWEEIA